MISAVIVASGRGARMGKDINKVYLNLAGQPVLMQTINAFLNHANITELIVVYHPDDANRLNNLLKNIDTNTSIQSITGGASRTDSVRRGLSIVGTHQKYVLIHDAARPFVTQKVIDGVIEGLKTFNAVVPTVPVTDTLKKIDGSLVIATVDRATLTAAQTPQGFEKQTIAALYNKALQTDKAFTDDASIAEYFNEPVLSVLGDPHNIKLTTPFDLKLGELLIKEMLCE